MTPREKRPVRSATEAARRLGYAAIGGPVVALKAFIDRVDDMSFSLRGTGQSLRDSVRHELERWMTEGRKIILSTPKRATDSGPAFAVAPRPGAAAPDEPLTTVNGVGPTYAARLAAVGIDGIGDFLGLTGTEEDVKKLANSTGFSAGTIESWRNQVDLGRIDGVGGSYQRLLHLGGIWTVAQLGSSDPDRLVMDLAEIVPRDGGLEQVPSIYSVKKWQSGAKRLVTSNGVSSG